MATNWPAALSTRARLSSKMLRALVTLLLPRAMRASQLAVRANHVCQCCNRPPHFVQVLVAVSFRGASSQSLSTCAGAVSKIGEMSSSCGDDNDHHDDQSNPRTPETCASDACAAFIASMTDDAMQDMSTGLATCTGPFANLSAYGAGGTDGSRPWCARNGL